MAKKTPFQKVKFDSIKVETAKALLVKCFDGSEAWLPKSQIRVNPVEDSILVPSWLIKKTGLQAAEKLIWA